MAETDRAATLRRALETFIRPDESLIADVGATFTDDVSVWSPNLSVQGHAELLEALAFRLDSFSEVDLVIDALDLFGNKGLAEFRVSAKFSGAFVLDEDVVIEPNGSSLLLGAAAVAEFEGARIRAIRAYFDDATLLEQMLAE